MTHPNDTTEKISQARARTWALASVMWAWAEWDDEADRARLAEVRGRLARAERLTDADRDILVNAMRGLARHHDRSRDPMGVRWAEAIRAAIEHLGGTVNPLEKYMAT